MDDKTLLEIARNKRDKWVCANCGRIHTDNIFYCQCGDTEKIPYATELNIGLNDHTFATFWNTGKITTALVQQAIAAYRDRFHAAPSVLVAGAHRADQARDVATACGLILMTSGGLLAGEFWLGGSEQSQPQPNATPTQLTLL